MPFYIKDYVTVIGICGEVRYSYWPAGVPAFLLYGSWLKINPEIGCQSSKR
jgi:hypothetical protein